MSITSLEKLLKSGSGGELDRVIRRAKSMDDLTTAMQDTLPADLASNLLSANLRDDGELVLVCSSSAWAARLRFESDGLVEVVRDRGSMVKSCRVTVSQQV